jgi:hypothetical protein
MLFGLRLLKIKFSFGQEGNSELRKNYYYRGVKRKTRSKKLSPGQPRVMDLDPNPHWIWME